LLRSPRVCAEGGEAWRFMLHDRVGMGWRPELAAGIFAHFSEIDVIEVIADEYFDAPRSRVQALRTVAAQVPVVLHGVAMGLASPMSVEPRRVEQMARLLDQVRPEFWSEHLGFIQPGPYGDGRLTVPPRTDTTVIAAAENLHRANRVTGLAPMVENVAIAVEPAGSTLDEATWLTRILGASGCDLLLDLPNVCANAPISGFCAREYIASIPARRIRAVHLAGDGETGGAAAEVFELLEHVAGRVPHPLTVILERDGSSPAIQALLEQLAAARRALAAGRRRLAGAAALS
jgi:uncharacterized protein